jgi:hypothetical protein
MRPPVRLYYHALSSPTARVYLYLSLSSVALALPSVYTHCPLALADLAQQGPVAQYSSSIGRNVPNAC